MLFTAARCCLLLLAAVCCCFAADTISAPAKSIHAFNLTYSSIIANNMMAYTATPDFDFINHNMPFSTFYI